MVHLAHDQFEEDILGIAKCWAAGGAEVKG